MTILQSLQSLPPEVHDKLAGYLTIKEQRALSQTCCELLNQYRPTVYNTLTFVGRVVRINLNHQKYKKEWKMKLPKNSPWSPKNLVKTITVPPDEIKSSDETFLNEFSFSPEDYPNLETLVILFPFLMTNQFVRSNFFKSLLNLSETSPKCKIFVFFEVEHAESLSNLTSPLHTPILHSLKCLQLSALNLSLPQNVTFPSLEHFKLNCGYLVSIDQCNQAQEWLTEVRKSPSLKNVHVECKVAEDDIYNKFVSEVITVLPPNLKCCKFSCFMLDHFPLENDWQKEPMDIPQITVLVMDLVIFNSKRFRFTNAQAVNIVSPFIYSVDELELHSDVWTLMDVSALDITFCAQSCELLSHFVVALYQMKRLERLKVSMKAIWSPFNFKYDWNKDFGTKKHVVEKLKGLKLQQGRDELRSQMGWLVQPDGEEYFETLKQLYDDPEYLISLVHNVDHHSTQYFFALLVLQEGLFEAVSKVKSLKFFFFQMQESFEQIDSLRSKKDYNPPFLQLQINALERLLGPSRTCFNLQQVIFKYKFLFKESFEEKESVRKFKFKLPKLLRVHVERNTIEIGKSFVLDLQPCKVYIDPSECDDSVGIMFDYSYYGANWQGKKCITDDENGEVVRNGEDDFYERFALCRQFLSCQKIIEELSF